MGLPPMKDALAPSVDAPHPQVAETHTGLVFLVGDRAYKVKKPVITDFLDFSTLDRRENACAREVALNRRLAPRQLPGCRPLRRAGGRAGTRHRDAPSARRAPAGDPGAPRRTRRGAPDGHRADPLAVPRPASRGREVDAQARVEAITGRWQENLSELERYADGVVPGLDPEMVDETRRLAIDFVAGRSVLFARRIAERRIVDGHADLLADDIFCLDDGPELLDCLEFDDRLRYVDTIDDAAFLAMDLEFLGRPDLGDHFLATLRPTGRRRRTGVAAALLHRLPRRGARQGRLRSVLPGPIPRRPPTPSATSRSPATTCAPARCGWSWSAGARAPARPPWPVLWRKPWCAGDLDRRRPCRDGPRSASSPAAPGCSTKACTPARTSRRSTRLCCGVPI